LYNLADGKEEEGLGEEKEREVPLSPPQWLLALLR
jgi:hypothetical protein